MYRILHIPTGEYIYYIATLSGPFPKIINLIIISEMSALTWNHIPKATITDLELPIILNLIEKWGPIKCSVDRPGYWVDFGAEFEIIEV